MRKLMVLVVALSVLAPAAQAAFPGANGKIAFQSHRGGNWEIYVMDPDGGNQINLTNNSASDAEPAFSPDGERVAFTSHRDGNFEIYVMNADGSGQTRLTNDPVSDSEPAWSPDGQKIAFRTVNSINVDIHVMNADGTGETRLTSDPASDVDPAWSPDGSKIAFTRASAIHVMGADGSGATNLTSNLPSSGKPAWSPDGQKIAFMSAPINSTNVDVYVMDANGHNQTRMTSNPGFDGEPAWSPDGRKIAFRSTLTIDGVLNDEIYTMDADGGNETRLSHYPGPDAAPDWQPQPRLATNTPPTVQAGGPYSGDEGAAIPLAAAVSDFDADDIVASTWTYIPDAGVDPGASCSFADPTDPSTTVTCTDDGNYTLTLTGDDGEATSSDAATLTVANVSPAVGTIAAPTDPMAVGTSFTVSAPFTDPGNGDTHTCSVDWGDTTASAGTVNANICTASHSYSAAGVYTLLLTVADDDGGGASQQFQYLVVYDPAAGWVAGRGFIDSPAGAYLRQPELTGPAQFAFVSRYKRGAAIPSGRTAFVFKLANLKFFSESYEWLVVSGARAQYKGTGTINDAGYYGFLLTAVDGALPGGGGTDKFRIKIWEKDSGNVVYDNQHEDDDNAEVTTEITSGRITIHSK